MNKPYLYFYNPNAPSEVNVTSSQQHDKLRGEMAPTTEQLRKRVLDNLASTNGKKR